MPDFDLDFERRQINHREQWRVLCYAGAIGHLYLAHLAVDRRLYVQAVNLTLQVAHHELLSIEQRLFAVDIEMILLRLLIVGAFRLLEGELGFLQGILCPERLQLRVGTLFVGLAASIAFALRRLLIDLGLIIGIAQLRERVLRIEGCALPIEAQTRQGGLFLRQLCGQVRTVVHREYLTLGNRIAGMYLERDGAQGVGVESWTDRGHHLAVGGNVADEIAPLHCRNRHP